MLLGTNFVTMDEPALNLVEVNLMSPDGKWHRDEKILVIRNDKVAEYIRDMGLVTKVGQLRIIGGGVENGRIWAEETVGSLRDMADEMRNEKQFDLLDLTQLDKIRS